ncbi:FAD-dependent monooxygenase [Nonomuraea sp. NPDC026600]|uniref:FAD-dependent monooxygenase n=1 Tax=Nonomuraea sp. NPDC026600 TaxID=3155363 RepID=UPI0033FF6B3A
MTTSFDGAPVLVLGNGPVGQTAALLLARWGIPAVVVDGRPERDLTGSKAIVQQRDVLDIWESVGAGAEIARRGLTWSTSRTFYRDSELFSVDFADRGRSPFPPFVNISQAETEAILDARIASEPLVDVRWGHRVTGIAQDGHGVSVTCATTSGEVVVRGSYAIAATGPRCDDIRAMLGLSFGGESFEDHFLICDIRTTLPGWEKERRFYFDPPWNPGRQVLIHPCPDSTFRIDWQVPPGFDLAAEEACGGLDDRIRKVIGPRPYEIVWKSVYRFHSRVVDRMRVGRVLVAGDAAHLVSPFGARGLNSGVQDAENAAWKLAFVLHDWAPETLLDSYHDERHAAALENIDVTGATMRFLVPTGDEQMRHRLAVLQSARTDEVARAKVDSGRLAEPFWYVDSPLTTPDESHPFAGRPARGEVPMPGPGVLVPDLPLSAAEGEGRLRVLARSGVAVLYGGSVDPSDVATALEDIPGPVGAHAVKDLAREAAVVLGIAPDEVWVLRPDGYVAAVLHAPHIADITGAVGRALGHRPAITTGRQAHKRRPIVVSNNEQSQPVIKPIT